jgi:HEAT repeat protein
MRKAREERARAGAPRAKLSPEEREKLEAERREEEARLAREIEDPDAWVRAEAVRRVAPEGEGEEVLNELLARDPSPQVRAAAALRLGGGESFSAVDALLKSLSDPSPQVVIAALDSLEDVGDASIIPKLEGLMNHPDPEVREAVVETMGWLD